MLLPEEKEIKGAVFELSGSNANRPDGFTSAFYQSCWDTVGENIIRLVRAVFYGQEITKSISHTNLVLIPKVEVVNRFIYLRHINLSSFANKIISRVIHGRNG